MSSCPFCLEEMKDGARKCPHCQSLIHVETEKSSSITYVVDKGIVSFGKFALGVLAIFTLVGIYLFGIDLKKANENATLIEKTKIEIERNLYEVNKTKDQIEKKLSDIEPYLQRLDDTEREVSALYIRIRDLKGEAEIQVAELRKLNPDQLKAAEAEKAKRAIPAESRLWSLGSTVRYRFLDGSEVEKGIVSDAFNTWSEHMNLNVVESDSLDSEIRVSFKPGSGNWSYIGTDALGVEKDSPTLQFHDVLSANKRYVQTTVLHEVGHALGLVHEFQNPQSGPLFDEDAVIRYFTKSPAFWTREKVEKDILAKSEHYPLAREFDPFSIMNFKFHPSLLLPNVVIEPGSTLSESDKQYVSAVYPKN